MFFLYALSKLVSIILLHQFWQLWEGQTLELHRKNNGFWKIFKFQCLRKLLPKWSNLTSRINSNITLKTKTVLKTYCFWCWFCINFQWIWNLKIIPKWGPGHPQLFPGRFQTTSWTLLVSKNLPGLNFFWFTFDLGWILEGFRHQHGLQSGSKATNLLLGFLYFIFVPWDLNLPASSLQSFDNHFAMILRGFNSYRFNL